MSPEDQYPSTSDASRAPDLETCLIESRRRVDLGWTRDTYVDKSRGQVCAVGGVFATDGVTADQIDEALSDASDRGLDNGAWYQILAERRLSQTARDAIDLLNQVAAERHPDADVAPSDNWSGMLEWVNQSWREPGEVVKLEVLAIYDEAIRRAASA